MTTAIPTPEIKFTRIIRACPRNEAIAKGESSDKIIYDYEVRLDGEHRATFTRCVVGVGYMLADVDGNIVSRTSFGHGRCRTKDFFRSFIIARLDVIPTAAEAAATRARKAAAEAAEKIAREERARVRQIQEAAPALFDAAERVLREFPNLIGNNSLGILRAAVELAKTGGR